MTSYTKHRQLTSQIVELADILAAQSRRLCSAHTVEDHAAVESLDRSTAWLRQALGDLIMAATILYQPDVCPMFVRLVSDGCHLRLARQCFAAPKKGHSLRMPAGPLGTQPNTRALCVNLNSQNSPLDASS